MRRYVTAMTRIAPNAHGEIPTSLLPQPDDEQGEFPCFACGRETKGDKWVHLANDGFIVSATIDLDDDRDQGWFPIGPECARKIPSNFVSNS